MGRYTVNPSQGTVTGVGGPTWATAIAETTPTNNTLANTSIIFIRFFIFRTSSEPSPETKE